MKPQIFKKSLVVLISALTFAGSAAFALDLKALTTRLGDNEQFNESWYFYFELDKGYTVYSTVMITNLGPGSKRPSFACTLIRPGAEPKIYDGRHDTEDIELAPEKGLMSMKTSYLKIEGDKLRYHRSEGELTIDLLLDPVVSGSTDMKRFSLGDDEDNYYEVSVPIPLGTVSGTITLAGKSVDVKGRGYFEHNRSNVTVPMLANSARRLVSWSKDQLIFAALLDAEEGTDVGAAFCFEGGSQTDTDASVVENGSDPLKLQLTACGKKLTLTSHKLVQRINMMDGLNFLEKAALGIAVGTPRVKRYRLDGDPPAGGFYENLNIE